MKTSIGNILIRYKRLLQVLSEQNELSMDEIEKTLNQTSKVVWRDISVLAELGLVIKKHGRVSLRSNTAFERRMTWAYQAKRAIARYVVQEYLMKESTGTSACIFMDAGSTIDILFQEMLRHEAVQNVNLSIVTNNLALTNHKCPDNIHLFLTGGEYTPQNKCLVGKAADFISQYQAKLAILSAANISFTSGYLGHNYAECQIKEAMLRHANEAIIVADHSKFVFLGGELISRLVLEEQETPRGARKALKAQLNNGDMKEITVVTNSDGAESHQKIIDKFFGKAVGLSMDDARRIIRVAPAVELTEDLSDKKATHGIRPRAALK